MADEELACLLELQNHFPNEGVTMNYMELKFMVGQKHKNLDEILEALVEKGIMKKFEFNGVLMYKNAQMLPDTLSGGKKASSGGASDAQLAELSKLVLALAESSGDAAVKELAASYKSKFA